ncbi:MAG: hypothetical protein K6E13_02260 [Lachnospiraceae bacterium]|nr:hypothetical protein [Lachnospiraceae bacterium]
MSYEWKYKYTTTTALKSVKVKSSSVAYTGKSITQTLTVKDTDGRIRAYKKVSGITYYGAWSNVKSVKVKK